MTASAKQPPSHTELLYASQKRKENRFRMNVTISWILLLLILVFLFSSLEISSANNVTQLSVWSYETVTSNTGIEILQRTQKVLYSLPIGLPGEGITISTVLIDTNFIRDNFGFIAGGIWQTIEISFLSIVLATILALLAALGRLSTFPPVYALSTFYVSLIRGTPLFLQIFFFWLALPQLGVKNLPGLAAGVIALGLNYGAYMSEIFRAGLSSVGKGQREAAVALGMTQPQTMQRVILPQALRFAIPPTGNEFIAMTKDSALISATGFVHEIMWRAQKVGRQEFRSLEALIMAAIFYWIMTLIFTAVQSRIEANLAKGDR